MFVLFSYVHPKGFYCLTKCPLFGVHSNVSYSFDQIGNIEALTPDAFETNYYKLWTNQTVEGYDIVYANEEMKLVKLDV